MVSRAIVTGSGHRTSTDGSRCATSRPAITCNFTKGGLIMTLEQLTVSVAIASWKNAVERADKVFRALTEDQYQHEIAPGRNRIIYLLGAISCWYWSSVNARKTLSARSTAFFHEAMATLTVNCSCVMINPPFVKLQVIAGRTGYDGS